jgi:hypothetical protein
MLMLHFLLATDAMQPQAILDVGRYPGFIRGLQGAIGCPRLATRAPARPIHLPRACHNNSTTTTLLDQGLA